MSNSSAHLDGAQVFRCSPGLQVEKVQDCEEKHAMNLPSFPNVDLFSAGTNSLNGALDPGYIGGASMRKVHGR